MDYDLSWERPHCPDNHPLWQESDWYVFYDKEAGIGGWHRIGQRPNQGIGQVTAAIFAQGGKRFLINQPEMFEVPIGPQDRWDSGFRVGSHISEAIAPQVKRFRWYEANCSGDLLLTEAFYTPRGWHKGKPSDAFASFSKVMQSGGKLQGSGRLQGVITLGDQRYEIDALMHRDRAWGVRDSSKMHYHRLRMLSGTAGPEFSFASSVVDMPDGGRACMGFVVRGGVEKEIVDLRVAPWLDADNYSVLGARGVFTLDDGEIVKIDVHAKQGFIFTLHGTREAILDTICTFGYQGLSGFCDLAIGNNPGRGSHIPEAGEVMLANVVPGLSDFVDYQL